MLEANINIINKTNEVIKLFFETFFWKMFIVEFITTKNDNIITVYGTIICHAKSLNVTLSKGSFRDILHDLKVKPNRRQYNMITILGLIF